jgi:hypothetical protein
VQRRFVLSLGDGVGVVDAATRNVDVGLDIREDLRGRSDLPRVEGSAVDVEIRTDASGDVGECVLVGSVGGDPRDGELLSEPEAVSVTTDRRNVVVLVGKFPGSVTADEAGATDHEC